MTINTTEEAFEAHIEDVLLKSGYETRTPSDFNREFVIDSDFFIKFIENSQAKYWKKILEIYHDSAEIETLRALERAIEKDSLIHVIRNGFDVSDVHLDCYFKKSPSSNNPDMEQEFEFNKLSLIRQLQYQESSTKAVDLGFFLNGLPVATSEIKNYSDGHLDAINQYKTDRDPIEKLFLFKRGTLVHFVIDPDEVHMTTKLAGNQTTFLPFNKGKLNKGGHIGKGNPENPNGYNTSYLWEEILQKDQWLDIVENFIELQEIPVKNSDPKEVLIFPRYHQLDVVNYLTNETKNNETGKNYLVEHSTGSGKSNSIAWMAYKLFSLHDGSDPVFDSIIVLSDRIGIVDQLAKTVEQFQKKSGTTKEMESTKELVENLENYRRILITTQQKFPPALKKIEENKGKIKGKKFAILIDEAHSSQTGEDAKRVKELLTKNLEEAEKIDSEDEEKSKDLVDELEEHVISHGNIPTLNYYAFTATPKWKTLKLFGRLVLDENGNPIIDKKTGNQTYVAHHKYTMNQAIEEGFILDVLKDYTAYEQIFQLVQLSKDKIVETKKALVSLLKFVNSHEKSIREKSEVIVDDFEENVKDQINGKAKAMVVTSSRLHAVRFKQTIDEIIKERGYTGINTLVAFSGTVKQNGDSFTQSNMTKMTEKQLVESFDSDDYNILIVAEKYQTGFDQPLLHTMYVDKYLKGIKAVQTLSRLNRAYKDKNSTHVIDFRNDPKLIQRAYEGFYYGASLIDDLKPEFLEKLYSDIFSPGVFTIDDIEKFWDIFSKTPAEQIKSDAPALDGIISAPRSSYDAIEDEKIQEKFRLDIRKYHEVYSFMTNLFSFSDLKYEKLFAIIKYCLKTRKFPGFSLITDIQNDVTLASYKLKLSSSGSISLGPAKATHGINGTSSTKEPEVLTSLSEVIKRLNEKFGKGEATPADILAYTELLDFLNTSEKLKNIAKVNPLPDFLRHLKDNFNDYLLNSEISSTNEKLVVTLLEKTAYRDEVIEFIGTIFHSGAKESFIPAISSDNPAENKLRFRQAIESCDGFIKWEDRYLDAEGLEYLEVINKEKVKKIQLLTSVYHWGVNEKLLEKFKELKQNLEKHGISCEMQVIMTKDLHRKMHDRYILSENLKYNVPSPTQVKFGQYSEIKITNADVPFDEWWNDSESIDIIQNWDKVKAKREQLSRRY